MFTNPPGDTLIIFTLNQFYKKQSACIQKKQKICQYLSESYLNLPY